MNLNNYAICLLLAFGLMHTALCQDEYEYNENEYTDYEEDYGNTEEAPKPDENEYYDGEYDGGEYDETATEGEEYAEYEEYMDVEAVYNLCQEYTGEGEGFYESPSGESYYLFCTDEKADCYEAKCPEETPYFVNGSCEAEREEATEEVETEEPIEPTEDAEETEETTQQTTETTKKVPKTTEAPTKSTTKMQESVAACPEEDDPTKVTFIASNVSCSQYFVCYHGEAISMFCTNKLHFNPVTFKCDFPINVGCTIDEPNKQKPRCKKNDTIEYYEHPEECRYFYFCNYGNISVQQCPHLHHFNLQSKRCIREHLSDCVNKNALAKPRITVTI